MNNRQLNMLSPEQNRDALFSMLFDSFSERVNGDGLWVCALVVSA
jgi:hypothetical protein